MKRQFRGLGFTLIELMVTIAVLAILLAIAVPNLRNFVVNSNLRGCVSSLQTDSLNARTEAIRLQRTVEMVPLSSTGWPGGWQVRVMALDGLTVDSVLLSRPSACEDVGATTQSVNLRVDVPGSVIRYDSNGFSRNGIGGFLAGCIRFDAPYTERASAVRFDSAGRPRMWRGKTSDAECI